jgi:Rrf2 family iron-sulfur cluster assembly transcriptional regulator
MLNQSAEYALRAMLYMAQGDGGSYKAPAIASALGIPNAYLGKVVQQLAKAGVLSSGRGPNGGYSLARGPGEISLREIAEPFQTLRPRSQCLLGNRPCDRTQPCAAHNRWRRINDEVAAQLNNTTLADMLTPEPRLDS